MGIFSVTALKSIARFAPAIFDIARQVKEYTGGDEKSELRELHVRLDALAAGFEALRKDLRLVLAGMAVLALFSLTALVLGIVALSR